jgi:hypothetical protein
VSDARTTVSTAATSVNWLVAVLVIGFLVPAGGFMVIAVSQRAMFRQFRGPLLRLLLVAGLALALQAAGVLAWVFGPVQYA